jgi:hypothetical protein
MSSTSALTEVVLKLKRLRSYRKSAEWENYTLYWNEVFLENPQAIIPRPEDRQCVCVLRDKNGSIRVPDTTEAECLAAASEYGLKWEWECQDTKLPKFLAEQFNDTWQALESLRSDYLPTYQTTRSKFFLSISLLLVWFFGGPFAGEAASVRFVVQGFGLMVVAYGVGVLRVLQYLSKVELVLGDAKRGLMKIKGELGINISRNEGNPIEITKSLTKERRSAYIDRLDEISSQLDGVKVQLGKSVWDAYTELFEAVKGKSAERQ